MTDDTELKAWFFREVFPLEAGLTRYIRRNWRSEADVPDIRQDVYARVYAAARIQPPSNPRAFLFATARNHMINLAKRAKIVSFDLVADLEGSLPDPSVIDVEAHLTAREELRRVQAGLDGLPARCRQVVTLRRIEGLTTREVAERMNISVSTVEQQMVHGMRALADFLAGGSGRVRRVPVRSRAVMSEPGS